MADRFQYPPGLENWLRILDRRIEKRAKIGLRINAYSDFPDWPRGNTRRGNGGRGFGPAHFFVINGELLEERDLQDAGLTPRQFECVYAFYVLLINQATIAQVYNIGNRSTGQATVSRHMKKGEERLKKARESVDPRDRLVNEKQAAGILGKSVSWLQSVRLGRRRSKPPLPCVRINRAVFYQVSTLENYKSKNAA